MVVDFIKKSVNNSFLYFFQLLILAVYFKENNKNNLDGNEKLAFQFFEVVFSYVIYMITTTIYDFIGYFLLISLSKKDKKIFKITLYQTITLSLVVYFILILAFYNIHHIFYLIGIEENIMAETKRLFVIVIPSLLLSILNVTMQSINIITNNFGYNLSINIVNLIIIHAFLYYYKLNYGINNDNIIYIRTISELIFLILNVITLKLNNIQLLFKVKISDLMYEINDRAKYFFTIMSGTFFNNVGFQIMTNFVNKYDDKLGVQSFNIILNYENIVFSFSYSFFLALRQNCIHYLSLKDFENVKYYLKLILSTVYIGVILMVIHYIFIKDIIKYFTNDSDLIKTCVIYFVIFGPQYVTKTLKCYFYCITRIYRAEDSYLFSSNLNFILTLIISFYLFVYKYDVIYYLIGIYIEDVTILLSYLIYWKKFNFNLLVKNTNESVKLID